MEIRIKHREEYENLIRKLTVTRKNRKYKFRVRNHCSKRVKNALVGWNFFKICNSIKLSKCTEIIINSFIL